MTSKTKAVAYYRVSTDKQGKSRLGLEAQHEAVHRYVKFNEISLVKEVTEVESGRKKDRPKLNEALAYCKKNKCILLIAKLDRLGRSVSFISALMESGVRFIAVDNPHANELMLHIMAAFAEHERKTISANTKAALKAAKERGKVLGIYGINVLSKKNKIDSRKFAQRMKPIIVDLQRKGHRTVREITGGLNQLKVPTYRGNSSKWHVATVHKVISQLAS